MTTKGEVLIKVENLQKYFGENKVLDGISTEIHKGEVVAIIGPSGSGKSTFLRSLNLLEVPTGGRILFENVDITDPKVDINRHRQKIGMVFTVESLDRLLFGGRLNNAKAKTTLNLRPVFELKSKIIFKGNARGVRERLEEMVSLVPENTRRLIVCRCGEDTDVSEFTQMLKQRLPSVYIHQRVAGPVLSIHVDEGAFGAAYILKD